jgi:hypothetical protein
MIGGSELAHDKGYPADEFFAADTAFVSKLTPTDLVRPEAFHQA